MIIPIETSGPEIFEVVKKLEPLIINEDPHVVMAACLSMVIILMDPDIEPQQLGEAIKGMSDWASLYVENLHAPEVPVAKMN